MMRWLAILLGWMVPMLAAGGTTGPFPHDARSPDSVLVADGGRSSSGFGQASPGDYPPAGSPDPGPACSRAERPLWLVFFCSFMTRDIWTASGRPEFRAGPVGPAWSPLFDAQSGLFEGLKPIGAAALENQPRYAPWSRFFRRELGCSDGQGVNPYVFAGNQALRKRLLGLNWEAVARDPGDPTGNFEDGSMFLLFTLSSVKANYKGSAEAPLAAILSGLASGAGALRPDFGRDGELSMVQPDGAVVRLDDLDSAAKLVDENGWLFAPDMMRTPKDALADARRFSAEKGRPLVYVYLAQDILDTPWANNSTYRARLEYLVRKSAELSAANRRRIAVISHGWSGHIVASTVMAYPEVVDHYSIGPTPGPWNFAEYLRVLRATKVETRLMAGSYDFPALLGGGVAFRSQEPARCAPDPAAPSIGR